MKERIEQRIAYLESEIAEHEGRMNALTNEVRGAAAKYDAYSVVTFLPGKIESVKYEMDKLHELREQKRMLVWLMKEDVQ